MGAYIQSQELDYVARKGTGGQEKASKVNQVKQQEEDEESKEFTCKICSKKHAKFKRTYVCKYCNRKGHKAEACWTKFPEKAPGYVSPVKRYPTPGLQKKKRTRRSDYDASQSESESPNP